MANRWVVWTGLWGLVLLPTASLAFDHEGDAAMAAYIGTMRFYAGDDARTTAQMRFNFAFVGEYSPSKKIGVRYDMGWGWNGYPETKSPNSANYSDPNPVTTVWHFSFVVLNRFNVDSPKFFYLGAGLGLYSWKFKINGDVQRDPVTEERLQSGKVAGADPGLSALAGYEWPLSSRVALNLEGIFNYLFSANDRPDHTGEYAEYSAWPVFNDNNAYLVLRLGVKLYFDINRFEGPD